MDAVSPNAFDTASSLADDDASIDVIGGVSENILPSIRPLYMQLPPHHMDTIDIADDNAILNVRDTPNVNNNNINNLYTTNNTNLNPFLTSDNNDKPVVFLLFLK